MFGKTLIAAMAVVLLLATIVAPVAAASPTAGEVTAVRTMTWSAPVGGLSILPPGGFQLNGDCESGGNCSWD
jgi:hypothetical protein